MTIKLIAYGIAREILNGKEKKIELPEGSSISDLKDNLIQKYPQFLNLKTLSFAVGEEYKADDFPLDDNCEVVLIPPVSGG